MSVSAIMICEAMRFQRAGEPCSESSSHCFCSAPSMVSEGSWAAAWLVTWSLRNCRVSSTFSRTRRPNSSRRYIWMCGPFGTAVARTGMCS